MLITGSNLEAIGSGRMGIVDGHDIHHSNIAGLAERSPISIDNLILHVMPGGNA